MAATRAACRSASVPMTTRAANEEARAAVAARDAAISERDAETLGVADDHVGAKLARGPDEGEGEKIRGDDDHRLLPVCLLDESGVIADGTVGVGVLQQEAERVGRELRAEVGGAASRGCQPKYRRHGDRAAQHEPGIQSSFPMSPARLAGSAFGA